MDVGALKELHDDSQEQSDDEDGFAGSATSNWGSSGSVSNFQFPILEGSSQHMGEDVGMIFLIVMGAKQRIKVTEVVKKRRSRGP